MRRTRTILMRTTALCTNVGPAIARAIWRPHPPYSVTPEVRDARARAAAAGANTLEAGFSYLADKVAGIAVEAAIRAESRIR